MNDTFQFPISQVQTLKLINILSLNMLVSWQIYLGTKVNHNFKLDTCKHFLTINVFLKKSNHLLVKMMT